MSNHLKNKIAALRDTYAKDLKNKIEIIKAAWKDSQKDWQHDRIKELYRLVHNLYGSSSTYRFNNISNIALDLEKNISPLLEKSPSIEEKQCIQELIAKLVAEVKKIRME